MMTTWYWILGVLVYFQETTTSFVPENWQNIQPCQDPHCQQYQLAYQQPVSQYTSNLDQQFSSPNYHPVIQSIPLVSYYQSAGQREALACPLGHALHSQQGYQLDNQQKALEAQYHLRQVQQFQAAAEQVQEYKSSQQSLNNGYLPPNNQLQLDNVDIHQNRISGVSEQQSNNDHLQVINQNQQSLNVGIHQNQQLLNVGINHNQINEQSHQQVNTNYLQLINQNQHTANVGIQQNQYASSGPSQHQGKLKQTVKYDISHAHQPSHQQYSQNKNVYSDAKSSTNIEQHHDLHQHSEGSEESHEIDLSTGKKKKDHNAYYKFDYSVNDQHTGDIKNHKEERSGDEVAGEYSLVEEDGNVRTVKYFADWKTGFHATVHNSKPRS